MTFNQEWEPSWLDRQGKGRQIPVEEILRVISTTTDELQWRHIGLVATLWSESQFYEWSRPVVYSPGRPHHHSVDRGICALNSYWWHVIADAQAYDYEAAIVAVILWLEKESETERMGSKPWDWRPLLDWQWHGYGTQLFNEYIPVARGAVNKIRVEQGLTKI